MMNPSCRIHISSIVHRKVTCGKNVRIGKWCSIDKTCIISDNVRIGNRTTIRNIQIGENTIIESGVNIVGTQNGTIKIGKESYIGINNILDSSDSIIIGDFVHIAGPSTALWTHTSVPMCLNSISLYDPDRYKYRPTNKITIENNVYIGCNSTIYPGITICHHSLVAPNSAVNINVEPNTMVGGVPVKFIKKIIS